jgi:HSP20 family molecular chaperone IbpA
MEMPGVDKGSVDINVEDGVLEVQGRIDSSKYEGLQPVYTEYNIGNYARKFRVSGTIDQSKISAEMKDGVLTLDLPKAEAAKARTIAIS